VELLAFLSFAALVVAWIVAPNTTRLPLSESSEVETKAA
jgi:hypothetical protein